MIKPNLMNLRTVVFSYLCNDDIALYLLNYLETYNELILFGGVVRDFVFFKNFIPRDIDIVLVGPHEFLFDFERNIHFKHRLQKNSFGGYKITTKDCIFDIWHIDDTWGFKENIVEKNVNNLLKTVFLNVDAYAFNLTKQFYIDNCNNNGFPKEIDIIMLQNPNLTLNIVRALTLAKKYKVNLSEQLKKLIIKEYNNAYNKTDYISTLINEQKRHYNKIIMTFDEINTMLNEIQNL